MKIFKMLLAIAALSGISTLSFADVIIHNNTGYYLHVKIPYIGVGTPIDVNIAPPTPGAPAGTTGTGELRENKDMACIKQEVYVDAYREAPENRPAAVGPVASITLGKGFGGSLADVHVFTAIDAAGKEALKVTVDPR